MDDIKIIGFYRSISDFLRPYLNEIYAIILFSIFILLVAFFAYLLKEW